MDSNDIFDKSIWPLFTPGMHWALSDSIKFIGRLNRVEDDSVEYSIRSYKLPEGDDGLWHINALRDITFNLSDFDETLEVKSVTLCLGSQTLQCVKVEDQGTDVMFSMFSDTNILPLFVIDDDTLSVSVQFKESLSSEARMLVPPKAIHATGLLVKIKERQKPFFVAGSKESVLTWDGQQSRVHSKAITESFRPCHDCFVPYDTDPLKDAREAIVNNDDSTHLDLWNVLKLNRGAINWSFTSNLPDSPLSDSLNTPRHK